MTISAICEAHEARPFRPFVLVMADGSHVSVRHPEALAHPHGGRTIVVFEGPDDFRMIDLLLVTTIEMGNLRGNGKRSIRRGPRR